MTGRSDPVLDYCLTHKQKLLDRLVDYVRHPSVSTDPAYEAGMESSRQWLERYLARIGFEDIQRLDAGKNSGENAGGRHPSIFAQWTHATGKPTLLVYAHYDVQPPDPIDEWESPPFEAQVRNDRLYARGVSDDKGPSLIALDVLAAYLQVEKALPVNIKLLIEGEEETGSPSLLEILTQNRSLLKADAVLSADGARWRADLPCVNVGSRGNGSIGISMRTACKDLHSGRYGGAVPNALHVLTRLVASLHREDGSIAVPGYYDDVEYPDSEARRAMAEIPFDESSWFESLQSQPVGEAGWSTLERLWLRPTLEVNGLWGGYQGAGAKTVIPSQAHAKLTTRIVTGQDPAKLETRLRQHLVEQCPAYATLEFENQHGWVGAHTLPDQHPLLLAAERALEATTGEKPLRVRIGATLPLTDIIKSALGIDTVMFSFSTADEDYHAPNEFLRLRSIDEGLAAWVQVLRELTDQEISMDST